MAPIFIDFDRAYLSIQAPSASDERLFGDAGYSEGDRRQHNDDSMNEMLLMIRRYLLSYIETTTTKVWLISSRAQAIVDFADKICSVMSTRATY